MPDDIDFSQTTTEAESARIRSTIEFPYGDQNQAVEVARKIHTEAGMECTVEQLAAWFTQSRTSGTFRQRLSTARIFGFIETERGGNILLTPLGREVVDPGQEQKARAQAFMVIPLYKSLFEKFKGYTLPPRSALEKEITQLGVSPKQKTRARQAFERSATQAGYFQHGTDRLVQPAFRDSPDTKPLPEPDEKIARTDGNGGGNGNGLHPFITGLIEELPEPKSDWSMNDRAQWLKAAEQVFKLIYTGGDDGAIMIEYELAGKVTKTRSRTLSDSDDIE